VSEFWAYLQSRSQQLIFDTTMHASAVAQSLLLGIIIAVVLGILVYRSKTLTALAIGVTSTILTVPSFAMLGLLIPFVGLGVPPTITALVLYALLPIVRNTVVGLRGVDPAMTEAARGIGMPQWRILLRVALPLAWPGILAGIRVSTQMIMGRRTRPVPDWATRSTAGCPGSVPPTPSNRPWPALSAWSSWPSSSTSR
jgi:osmoprotectant transport system permease protein